MSTGTQLKLRGMKLARDKRNAELDRVRYLLRYYAHGGRDYESTADDAHLFAQQEGIKLGNAAGSVFMDSNWEFTGKWAPSQRPEAHRRYIRVWRLKNVRMRGAHKSCRQL